MGRAGEENWIEAFQERRSGAAMYVTSFFPIACCFTVFCFVAEAVVLSFYDVYAVLLSLSCVHVHFCFMSCCLDLVAVRLYYKRAENCTIKKRTQKWLQNRSDEMKRRLRLEKSNKEKIAQSSRSGSPPVCPPADTSNADDVDSLLF